MDLELKKIPNDDYIKTKYEGDWDNGINGKGILTSKNCSVYIGDLNKVKYCGYGKYIWTNGDYFIGEFKEDIKYKGKLFYSDENGVFDSIWEYNKEKDETIAKGIFYNDDGTKEKRIRIITNNKSFWRYE